MVAINEDYAVRPIRFLDLWAIDGWTMKAYAIAYRGLEPGRTVLLRAPSVTPL